jgi:hypothetical protein
VLNIHFYPIPSPCPLPHSLDSEQSRKWIVHISTEVTDGKTWFSSEVWATSIIVEQTLLIHL